MSHCTTGIELLDEHGVARVFFNDHGCDWFRGRLPSGSAPVVDVLVPFSFLQPGDGNTENLLRANAGLL
ncbi:hypothetical protein D3C85_1753090 [compost metagenome]